MVFFTLLIFIIKKLIDIEKKVWSFQNSLTIYNALKNIKFFMDCFVYFQ